MTEDTKFFKYPNVILKGIYPKECSDAIEWAGRQSTATIGNGEVEKFTKARVKEGHLSLLRFVTAHFEIHCSRDTSLHMLRHKFLDFCQLSQRYTKQVPHFIMPPCMVKEKHYEDKYKSSCFESYLDYLDLLDKDGVKKEDARFVLPGSCMTSLAVTMNLQAARDFLNLRLSKRAQWEIRYIAVFIGKYLLQHCYNLVFDLEEKIKQTEVELIKNYESYNILQEYNCNV